jgi:4-amino-4-deoxy-L-arabinose transferase-like glycosyltransferase
MFIAGAYFLIGDWITSAMAVSWVFGCAVFLPVFLLFRRFFDRSLVGLGLLLFAVMPVFVYLSSEVIKESVAVFFAACGFHFFLCHIEERRLLPLLGALLCFLLGCMARIEALIFFGVSWLFLLFFTPRRWATQGALLLFSAVMLIILVLFNMLTGLGAEELFRSKGISHFIRGIPERYEALRASLKGLAYSEGESPLGLYLAQAPNLLWFSAIGSILRCFVKTLFYPFAIFFAVGIPRAWRLIVNDKRVLYLAACAVGGFFVLYLHNLTRWFMFPRYMALMLLPAIFVSCCGIGMFRDLFLNHFRIREALVVGLLSLGLIFSTLPKNIQARECDKTVFKEIASAATAAGVGDGPFLISASAGPNQRWVPFYANVEIPGAFPPDLFQNSWDRFPKKKEQFISELYMRNITFVLWDERNWGNRFPVDELLEYPGIRILGRWNHVDTGKMILMSFPKNNQR